MGTKRVAGSRLKAFTERFQTAPKLYDKMRARRPGLLVSVFVQASALRSSDKSDSYAPSRRPSPKSERKIS
jgi:hypothetical protein